MLLIDQALSLNRILSMQKGHVILKGKKNKIPFIEIDHLDSNMFQIIFKDGKIKDISRDNILMIEYKGIFIREVLGELIKKLEGIPEKIMKIKKNKKGKAGQSKKT